MTRKPADFERLGDLLKDGCGLPPGSPGAAAAETRGTDARTADGQSAPRFLALAWPEIVGEEVAANTTPVQLRQGRLVVSASSSAWAQTLQLMGDVIIARVNERLGPGTVERVIFRHAGWEGRGGRVASGTDCAPAAGPASTVAGEEEAAIARVKELCLGPELEESILRAVRASFRRA